MTCTWDSLLLFRADDHHCTQGMSTGAQSALQEVYQCTATSCANPWLLYELTHMCLMCCFFLPTVLQSDILQTLDD